MSNEHTYRGYTIERGSYTGTHQHRSDRWYIDAPRGLRDRSGEGYRTLDAAKAAIDERVYTYAQVDRHDCVVAVLDDAMPGTRRADAIVREHTRDGHRVVVLECEAKIGDHVAVNEDGCATEVIA